MTQQWDLPAWAVVTTTVAAVLLVLLVAVLSVLSVAAVRGRRHLGQRLAGAEQSVEALRAQVTAIERRLSQGDHPSSTVAQPAPGYLITGLDPGADAPEPGPELQRLPAGVVPAPLFADLVLRESVVQAASLAAGVRRALAPETRNRVRFQMRQEVKRARRQRRVELREARRDWEARQRRAASRSEGSAA